MMSDSLCNQDLMDRFLNDELTAIELDAFKQHVNHCEVCREQIDQTRSIEKSLNALSAQREPSSRWLEQTIARLNSIEADGQQHGEQQHSEQQADGQQDGEQPDRSPQLATVNATRSPSRYEPHQAIAWTVAASVVFLVTAMAVFPFRKASRPVTTMMNPPTAVEPSEETAAIVTESPSTVITSHRAQSLAANPGYLAAQIPSDDPNIEIYYVLPIASNSN